MTTIIRRTILLKRSNEEENTMSWAQYVDESLVGTGLVTKGAIYGHDGTLWSKEAKPANNITASAKEVETIMKGFDDPKEIQQHGLKVSGTTYIVLRSTDKSIYAKRGQTGLALVKTTKALIIGFYDDKIQPGQCTTVVEKLGNYLREAGY